MSLLKSFVISIFVLFAVASVSAQTKELSVPRIVEKDGRHALLVDGKPFLILEGQAHNTLNILQQRVRR